MNMEKTLDIKAIVAKNLIKYRKQANLTQLDLAKKLNYSDKAISKWERGEAIPDIYVLKQIADLYNIELENLLHQETTIEKIQSFTKNRYVILTLSIVLVWLLAMITFVVLMIFFPDRYNQYLALPFVIAIPVSFILAVIFNSIWGSRIYNMVFVSGINWGVGVTLVVSLVPLFPNVIYVYLICAIFEILIVLWYMLDSKRNTRPKNVVLNKHNQKEE